MHFAYICQYNACEFAKPLRHFVTYTDTADGPISADIVAGGHLSYIMYRHKGAQWLSGLERRTGDRVILGSNPAGATSLRNFGNSVCQCLSEETLRAVGPFYLLSMSGEVIDPTWGVHV